MQVVVDERVGLDADRYSPVISSNAGSFREGPSSSETSATLAEKIKARDDLAAVDGYRVCIKLHEPSLLVRTRIEQNANNSLGLRDAAGFYPSSNLSILTRARQTPMGHNENRLSLVWKQ